jgi:S-adenosylmethionine/arginine decarboxylase-like enzyme
MLAGALGRPDRRGEAMMQHFMLDGFGGIRSRFDDMRLVYELLEELPARLGLQPVMPPLLLPYYNGVEPDDCGISGFAFLAGGHITVHTFSFRECYFVDLATPQRFDAGQARDLIRMSLPAGVVDMQIAARGAVPPDPDVHPDKDFGPHLLLDLRGYSGPRDLDGLFSLFDELPERIDMTPIMRPYAMRSKLPSGGTVSSVMTMIAESHIALHVEEATNRAWFDIFSCKFFDTDVVLPAIRAALPGEIVDEQLIARGHRYSERRTVRDTELDRGRAWLSARPGPAHDA